ncbi:hypothetical protein SAMN05216456_3605 [Devosia crocina]|uniref:YggT family protein n=1 Tax=Devosia crocina TaxID=429728 RepID=A0A1I7NVR8_9HYPH|nr:hypothetical protein [Devosia crocina]SFV38766.1 hypothetical protein SAMN05216456_3605 [Devosia crocina]
MDILWIAIVVDLILYGLLGLAVVKLATRFLPPPWNTASFTVPLVVAVGALITLVTFPHWVVFPR